MKYEIKIGKMFEIRLTVVIYCYYKSFEHINYSIYKINYSTDYRFLCISHNLIATSFKRQYL